jgi:hypothetical protein
MIKILVIMVILCASIWITYELFSSATLEMKLKCVKIVSKLLVVSIIASLLIGAIVFLF